MTQTNFNLLKALLLHFTFNILLLTCFPVFSQSGAAINNTGVAADQSAILDVSSTNAGMLIPRMTKTQRNGINLPAEGLLIYQITDTIGFWYHSSGAWKLIGSSTGSTIANGTAMGNTLYWDGSQWKESSNIYNEGNSVGIGTNSPEPTAKVEIYSSNSGLLIPRLSTAERNGIQNPAEGLQIFNTTTKCFEAFIENNWNSINCYGFKCGSSKIYDADNNIYNTVLIGSQCWMKENLKTTKYNDNTPIPLVTDNVTWSGLNTPAYCWYENNELSYKVIYGALYNWYVNDIIINGNKNVCPSGWHIPSDDEIKTLEIFLGMSLNAANLTSWRGTDEGGKLKATDATYWISPNTGATNISDFNGLGCGYREVVGTFDNINVRLFLWSSTAYAATLAWKRRIAYNHSAIDRNMDDKKLGYSLRCIKD